MVIVLTSNSTDRVLEPGSGQANPNNVVVAISPPGTRYSRVRAETGWVGIRIMCPSGKTYVHVNSCLSDLAP
jgi:hypothetical protein